MSTPIEDPMTYRLRRIPSDEGAQMNTYYFLVGDPSDEIVIASIEADSPKDAFAILQPLL